MRQNKWLNECKFEKESLKKIIEQENEKQNLRQIVVNIIKEEKKLVRDTVEKYKQVWFKGGENSNQNSKREKGKEPVE